MVDGFYSKAPSYDGIRTAVYNLKSNFSDIKAFPIGKSVLGRGIFALGIGELHGASLFVGGVHGSEWLTVLLLFRFIEDVLTCIDTGSPIAGMHVDKSLSQRGIVVIPCLNPDGVEIATQGVGGALHLSSRVDGICGGDTTHWQANARGVDLNHNFDAGWKELKEMEHKAGIYVPAMTRYGGERPHSEPEVRAIVNFCAAFQIKQAYAFHSQGEEIYYKYGEHTPARSQLMARMLAASCGYKVCVPQGLASHGGFKDWFIDKLHRPAFTIEIGRGENPLPVEELEPIYARIVEMMLIATLL